MYSTYESLPEQPKSGGASEYSEPGTLLPFLRPIHSSSKSMHKLDASAGFGCLYKQTAAIVLIAATGSHGQHALNECSSMPMMLIFPRAQIKLAKLPMIHSGSQTAASVLVAVATAGSVLTAVPFAPLAPLAAAEVALRRPYALPEATAVETPAWPQMSLMGVDRGLTTGPALQETCNL